MWPYVPYCAYVVKKNDRMKEKKSASPTGSGLEPYDRPQSTGLSMRIKAILD